ncbi:unnamed protein product [Pylaiella littoralis]
MTDVGALAGSKAGDKPIKRLDSMGSVTDFIEILNATVGKHFKCCICLSILGDPVMLPCNHPLCRGCAAQCLKQNQRCPQCLTAIPNLRMLQGRNKWIAEMVGSLKNCLNEVGVSLTQHAPVPSKYRDNPPPKPGAGRARARAGAGARASTGDASRTQRASASCGGSAGGRGRGEARRKGRGSSSGGGSRYISVSTGERPTPASLSDDEDAVGVPSSPLSPSLPPPPPPPPPRSQQPFVVGDLVFVDHRSWPGMNKHGGVALVTAVLDPPGSRYDVKYSVSRQSDRGVEARYVHAYAFPEETIGSRSRRGGAGRGDTRSRRHSGGGGIGSGSGSLSPRGRLTAPVIALAAGAGAARSTVTAASATAAIATSVQQPSPPRHSANHGGGHIETSDEEGSDREYSPAAAAAAAAATAFSTISSTIVIATAASSPASVGAIGGGSSLATAPVIAGLEREGEEGQGGDGDSLRRHDKGESTSDDAGEVSCQSDTGLTEEEEEVGDTHVNRGGCSSNTGVGDCGGGSSDHVYDDESGRDNDGTGDGDGGSNKNDSGAAAPVAGEPGSKYHEGRPAAANGERTERGEEVEAPAVALSPLGTPEKATGEQGTGETREEEEEEEGEEDEEDLAHDGRKLRLPTMLSEGTSVGRGATGGTAAPLSPTSRPNRPWRAMGLTAGAEKEQQSVGQRRRRDPPHSTSSSGARDPDHAGAAEGLMALLADSISSPTVARVEGKGEDLSMESASIDGGRAQTQAPSTQPPRNTLALGHSSSSIICRGDEVASAGPEQPLGALATGAARETPASPFVSPSRHSSSPKQDRDKSVAREAGSDWKDDDGDVPPVSDPMRSVSSTEVTSTDNVRTRAETPQVPAPSASSPSPLPPSRPSVSTALGWQQQTPRQAMPPPPPPSSSSPTPNASSSSSARLPPLPPPPPTPKTPAFEVGDLVSVPSRSAPGVNKEGGVAKVTLAHGDGTFDVKYIVRKGKEKGVAGAILSSYAVDDDGDSFAGGGGSGSGSASRGSGVCGSGGARDAAASGSSSSSPSSAVDAAARGGARNAGVRRTPRANKGWCSPDIAAGQANAACLNYLLGETQHQDLILDPDLGELLDPSEYSSSPIDSSSTSSASAGKARRHRESPSSGAAAAVNAEEEEKRERKNDDVTAASGREIRGGGSSMGGRGRSRGNGKRKRAVCDGDDNNDDDHDDDEFDEDGGAKEQQQQLSGDDQERCSQERRRRRHRRSGTGNTSQGSNGGTGGGSSKDVFDTAALSAESNSSADNNDAALATTTAVVDSDRGAGTVGDGSRNVFDITALSAGSDNSGDNAAVDLTTAGTDSDDRSRGGTVARVPAAAATTSDKKRGRPSGSVNALRATATATANYAGELPGTKKKSKATVAKAGVSSSPGGDGSEQGVCVSDRHGQAAGTAAAETEAGGAVVLTMSGSTPDMLAVAKSLAKSLGWAVESKYKDRVTHVVCGTVPKNAKAKVRSAKYLRAVASGKWVVTEDWLRECKRRRARVEEAAFEVSGDKKSVVPSAPTRSRLAHAEAGRPGLFHGITFHFRGEFGTTDSPPLSELEPMLLANGGRVVSTIASLFTRPAGAGAGAGGEGAGRRGSGGGSGSGGWKPRRVVIFQPSSASPAEDARALERELATLTAAEPSSQNASSESARGGGGRGGPGPDGSAVEVVKPIWLVDSVGCFGVLRPSGQHRLPTFRGES